MISPEWRPGQFGVLRIPEGMQKNRTAEEVPLLPGFEDPLAKIPDSERHGWVFNPMPLRKTDKEAAGVRLGTNWVCRIITRIGKAHTLDFARGQRTTIASTAQSRPQLTGGLALSPCDNCWLWQSR